MRDMEHADVRGGNLSRRDFLRTTGLGAAALASGVQALAGDKTGKETIGQEKGGAEGGYEYASGEVLLPFSYSVKPSPQAKPVGLDFSHQINPDNCQVFVRMEGELWEFRSQWIINLGASARYKGPDIDHMTRVEDAIHPDGMTSCWFLGGMWYDDAEHKLYAPMHIEHDAIRRTYAFSRKIALATSLDQGKTWRYEGDIVTSETYYYPHEFFKFSGSGYGIGLADFGFYVDRRGGYFYIFPDEGWAPWTTRGMRWNSRAARCAIGDKMAPGKWTNFYNGSWGEPALGGKSSIVAPSHFWGITYSTVLEKYICMFLGNQDPPSATNIDGIYIGACSDLSKQDWVWGHCPDAMFGFMNLINDQGTDIATTCADSFRYYAYFDANNFQRLDVKLAHGQTPATGLQTRFLFEPHPESSDPVLGRVTKIVGCDSPEVKYSGDWTDRASSDSYEGRSKESSTLNSSIEFSFEGTAVYWRALHSPQSGKADVYIDGTLRKTVDCFSPRSTSWERFAYINTGLSVGRKHTIKIVVLGKKHANAMGAAVSHVAFEYAAESYRASAGFSGLMGKNNWHYQRWNGSEYADLTFTPDEGHPKMYWLGTGGCEIGGDYQIPGDVATARKWLAPHGGVVRVEGAAFSNNPNVAATIWLNGEQLWQEAAGASGVPAVHDLKVTVIQGDALDFRVARRDQSARNGAEKIHWNPVITFIQSVPPVWQPNSPSGHNLALYKYARSKFLVSAYRPFDAVDGDLNTGFTLHADDKISSGDDWFLVDLENNYRIDRYVVSSQSADPAYRLSTFTLQRSDDGFNWTAVDSVTDGEAKLEHYYGVPMTKFARDVPAFRARYVRLYLPHGKPFTISEFELYYTEGKTSFGPPIPAGE
jgi:hypothetical protein